jgi:hypothetical protein
MGYNVTTITTAYAGLVGFRQSDNPAVTPIPTGSSLLTANSGHYVNDIPGIRTELYKVAATEDYANYATYLANAYTQEVLNCIDKFWNNKKNKYGAREVLENRVLNQFVGCYDDTKTFDGFAYGYKLKPYQGNVIKLEITKAALHLDTAATFNIYIYNTLQKAPLEVKSITVTADTATSVDLSSAIAYSQVNGIGGGELLLLIYGYYDDGHTSVQLPAGILGYSQAFQRESKYVNVEPVEINQQYWNWNGTTNKYDLPNLEGMSYTCETRGINLRFTAQCDYTQILVDNKLLFAPAIQRAVAIRLLWDSVNSYVHDANSESMREHWKNLALKYEMELYGYTDEARAQVPGFLEKIDLDLSGMDRVCLPCHDRGPELVRQPYF